MANKDEGKQKGKKKEVIVRPVVEIIDDGTPAGKTKQKKKRSKAERRDHREHQRGEGW